MATKLIYIKRTTPFVHDQISSEAMQEQLAATHRSIGSYFVSKDNQRSGSGLSEKEETVLIAKLRRMEQSNPKLYEVIETYYADLVTKVPGGKKGLELNIGLSDNSRPLCVEEKKDENGQVIERLNLPDNTEHYVRYRHALGYPRTAPSPEVARGNQLYEFYIEDPTKVIEEKIKDLDIKDAAFAEYLKMKEDNEKVNMVLSLMRGAIKKEQGVPPVNLTALQGADRLKEKLIILNDIVRMRPERFYAVVTDADIKKKYFVDQLLSANILARVGNSIVDTTDSNRVLGLTIDEVVSLLSNERESLRKNRLKAELNNKLQKSQVGVLTLD